jgi:hypothetical protein
MDMNLLQNLFVVVLYLIRNRSLKNSQKRVSAGANEDSEYFQPVACLGQQDLGVLHRCVEDIQVL